MNISGRTPIRLALLSVFAALSVASARAQQWTTPTPEELSMTSQPQVPGAAAVYLNREEKTDDKLHMFSIYTRIKVLTDLGKEFSNVELNYAHFSEGGNASIDEIQGRTIHPDGTIIPFTGKPYDKLIEKGQGVKVMAKVFSMPDVEVGSIIEYRYKLHYDDHYFIAPDWYIQSDLFTRKAHYSWRPTNETLVSNDDRGQLTNAIGWFPILPPGTELKNTTLPGGGVTNEGQRVFELDVKDVPPAPHEDFMPPIRSLSYRVLFYYTPYRTGAEFWKSEIKHWSKLRDKFIGPGSAVTAAVRDIVAPSDTQDQKVRKIYAAVMKLENSSYTRQHTEAEEKAQGFKEVRTADDIWTRKRGNDDQITQLFVAMVRAAGMKAYLARVTNRDTSLFIAAYLSLSQLHDDIAIVNIDGKDQYFDPGSRYCPYGHLAWRHSMALGIRQNDSGGDFAEAPPESYTYSRTQRIADLTIDQHSAVTGLISMTFMGSPALRWRQRSLTGDSASLDRELRTSVERLIPASMEIKVASITDLEDYEKPLVVKFDVKGTLGSSTGKRLLIPGDIFEANSKPAFPHEKREIAVYFQYAHTNQDAVRVKFPSTLTLESIPTAEKFNFEKSAAYSVGIESTPTSYLLRRNYSLGEIVFVPKQYADLRSFYSKFETKDQETVVLTTAPAPAKATPTGN
jgi:Domain of Unknown Function with PDB structure (DUF3857)/Transglutaminase-like superfamily